MRNRGVGLGWYGAMAAAAASGALGWINAVAMASMGAVVLAAMTYSIFSQRRMREVMPRIDFKLLLVMIALAGGWALGGTFAATKTVIGDKSGDHSISYGIVCALSLIFAYRAWIKRTPRSVAVLALFTHLFGFIVLIYNFFGTEASEASESFFAPMVIRVTPAALCMYGLLISTATAAAVALLHFIPAREDDELADVPAAHVVE